MPLPNRKIALIHVAKRKLGMDDAEYRAVLYRAGVGSARDLDNEGFDVVMRHFERCGFQSARTVRTRSKTTVPQAKARITAKIGAVREALGLSWGYIDGMARKMFGVDAVEWCDPDQLFKILQALVIHQKRVGKKEGRQCT